MCHQFLELCIYFSLRGPIFNVVAISFSLIFFAPVRYVLPPLYSLRNFFWGVGGGGGGGRSWYNDEQDDRGNVAWFLLRLKYFSLLCVSAGDKMHACTYPMVCKLRTDIHQVRCDFIAHSGTWHFFSVLFRIYSTPNTSTFVHFYHYASFYCGLCAYWVWLDITDKWRHNLMCTVIVM